MQFLSDWKPYGNLDPLEMNALADRMMIMAAILLLFPLSMSVSRATYTGWLPLYNYHIGAYTAALLAALMRRHLDGRIKVFVIIAGCLLVTASGHYSSGLFKGGAYFLPIALVLIAFFYGPKQLTFLFVASITGYIFIAWGFLTDRLTTELTLSEANQNIRYWLNTGFSLTVFFVITSQVLFSYRKLLANKVDEITAQRNAIEQLTNYCQLTGAATRINATKFLDQCLEKAAQQQSEGAILLIVIDNLSEINDQQGYDVGETMLKSTVERLKQLLRPDDFLARVAGSRFLVIIPEVTGQARTDFLADQIKVAMAKPVQNAPVPFSIQCTIGIVTFPYQTLNANQLIFKATEAASIASEKKLDAYHLKPDE